MTDTDLRTLRDIVAYRAAHGVSPTLLGLARAAGLSSASGAQAHVRALIRDGYLEASAGSRPGYLVSRGYRPTAKGLRVVLTADPTTPTCPECGQPTAGGAP